MYFQSILSTPLQALLYILISPGVIGMLRWVKARLQGRAGSSPLQPYWNLWKLFHRRPVIPETTSWVFQAAPFVVFGCYALIGLLVPVIYLAPGDEGWNSLTGPPLADFLVIVYLIGLARFATGLAGMDSGSPFGSMGSGREMYVHVLVEPVLVMLAYALALNAHTTSLSGMMSTQTQNTVWEIFNNPLLLFIFLALILVTLAETGRIPFDHPSGHLELTMISKAVQLEYGGPYLALMEWAEAMRLTFFMNLLANLFLPFTLISQTTDWRINLGWFLIYPVKLLTMIAMLAFYEMTRTRLRLRSLIVPAGMALAFSVLAVLVAVVVRYFTFY